MSVNAAAIAIIKAAEGCKLTAYQDGNGIWSIGYGHTGPEVVEGLTIDEDQADAHLETDTGSVDVGVGIYCPSATDNQHSAMCSLAYNIGLGNFKKSTVCRLHNAGDFVGAAVAFKMWNKIAGEVSEGLNTRRAAEAALYQQGAENV